MYHFLSLHVQLRVVTEDHICTCTCSFLTLCSLSLSVCLSLSLSLSFCLFHSVCLSVSVSLFLFLSHTDTVPPSLPCFPFCFSSLIYCPFTTFSPCFFCHQTMVERPATWKKLSAVSQNSANPGSMAVRYERSYHLQDEDATEVSQEDTVKGVTECAFSAGQPTQSM